MNINQIMYVLEVARTGNLSKAAENLFITQPALSLQIRKLEEELGYPIFERKAQGVAVLEEARGFLVKAENAARSWQELEAYVHPPKQKETISIFLSARVFTLQLFSAIENFFTMHHEYEVMYYTDVIQNPFQSLVENHIDIALDRFPSSISIPEKSELYYQPLISEAQCVITSVNSSFHPGAEKIQLQDLSDIVLVTSAKGSMFTNAVEGLCRKNNISIRKSIRTDNMAAIASAISCIDGSISFGPVSYANHFGLRAIRIVPEIVMPLNFICRAKSLEQPIYKEFVAYLLKEIHSREEQIISAEK